MPTEFEIVYIQGKKCLYSKLAGVFEELLSKYCEASRGIGPDMFFKGDTTYRVYNMVRDEAGRVCLVRTCKLILEPEMYYGSVLSKDILIDPLRNVHWLPSAEWFFTGKSETLQWFMWFMEDVE